MNEESLFVSALEKPNTAERLAFLRKACSGDDALRKRVERLLEAHEKTLGILDQSVEAIEWSEFAVGLVDNQYRGDERAGLVIAGRYRLIEKIGEGGMGAVWQAEQTQPVRRTVALKLVKSGLDSRTVLTRFEAERQALALMEHPNIARVLDGGTTESGRPFFVMEYVKGVSFTKYCDDACMSVAERLALFVPVCMAVQHAHTKGVIHRDLKPSNILVCPYDGKPVPKIIDFGLAKATEERLTEHSLNTVQGMVLGTPLYMSPEQAELNNLDVDTRVDVYALGVILYELLTGTTPLETRQCREAAWHEMLRLIKEEEPPRPSARLSSSDSLPSLAALRRLEPQRLTKLIRGDLDWIVMKCLEKDRSRRYETANGLARDLQNYLTDEPVEACPPSTGYRIRKFVRRNWGYVLSVAIILFLLVAGVVGTSVGLYRANQARKAEAKRAEGERRANEQAQKRLQQIERGSAFLGSIFKDLDPRAEEKEGKPLRAILGDRIAQQAEQIEGEALGDPLLAADLQYRLGLTLLNLHMPQRAIPLFEKARAVRTDKLGPDHRDTLSSMSALAEGYHAAGDLDRALPLSEETLKLRKAKLGADDSDTLFSMTNLAGVYKSSGKIELALPLLEQTLELHKSKRGDDHPNTLRSMNSLGICYMAARKWDLALPLLEQTLELRKAKLGVNHTDTLNSMNSLAECYRSARKLDEALLLHQKTLELRKAKLGADDPDTLISMNNLAAVYKDQGNSQAALLLLEESVRLSKARRGMDNPYTLGGMHNLAWMYRAGGKTDEALRLSLEAAIAIERRRFRDEFADAIITNLVSTQEQLKKYEDAEVWRRKWVAAVKENAGADSLRYAGEMGALGANLVQQKKWSEAESVLRESLTVLAKKASTSMPKFNIESLLGSALLGQKRYVDAEAFLIEGYEGIKAREATIPPTDRRRVTEAGEEIVRLYETWGQPKKAVEWRAKLTGPRESETVH